MKRNFVLAAVFAVFALAVSASAQSSDFSGTWTLDVSRSNPAETTIESQTMVITQTANDIKIDRTTKIKDSAAQPGGPTSRGGMPTTYGFSQAVKVTRQTPNGDIELGFSAKIDGKKLTLTTTSPQGARAETLTLNADGTLSTEIQGRNGAVTRVYRKN